MKQSALFLFVIVTLLKLLTTEAHFKPRHVDSSVSSPIGFQQTSALSAFGQSSDLKTALAVHKTVTFLNILTSNPKLLCIIPPFLVVDFLTQLNCNPAVLNAIPHTLLAGFMTSLSSVPTLANAIPQNLFVQMSNTLSIGAPQAVLTSVSAGVSAVITPSSPTSGPAPGLPGVSVTKEVAASISPAAPSSGPASGLPGVSVTKEVAASISPAAPSSGPAPGLPGVSVTKEAAASISPTAPTSGPAPGLPGVSVTNEVAASVSPVAPTSGLAPGLPGISVTKEIEASVSPAAPLSGPASGLPGVSVTKEVTASITPISSPIGNPVLPADLPTSYGASPNAYPPAAPLAPAVPAVPSLPCVTLPGVGSPQLSLPIPSPTLSPLSILMSLFNKGTGSQIEAKIDGIIKLFANGNLKLPQLHAPDSALLTKPVTQVKPKPEKVFILLPAPQKPKLEIPFTQGTKSYDKPESLNHIINFIHERLFTPPKKLSLPKLDLPNLTPIHPAVPLQTKPVKCLPPLFSKVPC